MLELETVGSIAWLIPTLTFAAFVAIVGLVALGGGGRAAGRIAVLAIAATAVLGVVMLVAALGRGGEALSGAPYYSTPITWAIFGSGSVTFGWMVDPLTVIMVAMVTFVCTMIFVYATGYMQPEFEAYRDPHTGEVDRAVGSARYARFFA